MTAISVVLRDRTERKVPAAGGMSLMEALRDGSVDELLALCGGCCSCATCHVVIDDAWIARVGTAGPNESDLLDSSDHRVAASRLSCQIEMRDELNGLRLTIVPQD